MPYRAYAYVNLWLLAVHHTMIDPWGGAAIKSKALVAEPYPVTVIVPDIEAAPWTWQKYGNVPGVLNVTAVLDRP